MLRRIKWFEKARPKKPQNADGSEDTTMVEEPETKKEEDNEEADMEDTIKEDLDKRCFLIWEGILKKKTFEKWRVVDVRSENEARRLLGERGCEHYWNMIATFQPERAEGELPEQLDKVLM